MTVKQNLKTTHFEDRAKVFQMDFRSFLSANSKSFDIVFLDPPYSLKLIPGVLNNLIRCDRLKPTATVICETAEQGDVFGNDCELSSRFEVKRATRYGAAFVTILIPKES
jgi:16S rRNA G966 N2-methylase RsmD